MAVGDHFPALSRGQTGGRVARRKLLGIATRLPSWKKDTAKKLGM